ncbi:MAG TPA: hypothetical protein ENI21_00690 [Pseudomonas sabulinigri]|nr:hypothetical protein [Halopseudomonas sabulinigri]
MSEASFRDAAQHRVTQGSRRPAWWGGLSFGYFSLAKQRKVTRRQGERRATPENNRHIKQIDTL